MYLVSELGVPASCIPDIVERCPKLLGCSISKNLRPTVSFFQEELKLDKEKLCNIVTKYPALLGLSIDNNLRPKVLSAQHNSNSVCSRIGHHEQVYATRGYAKPQSIPKQSSVMAAHDIHMLPRS